MKAKILKIEQRPSKYSRELPFFYFFFKGEDGKSYRSCISPIYRNYTRWHGLVEKAGKEEVWLDGLVEKEKGLIDADSAISPCHNPLEGHVNAPGTAFELKEAEPVMLDFDTARERLKQAREVMK